MDNLIAYIRNYINIKDKELDIVLSYFKPRLVPKDRFVLKRGQIVTDYYFIDSGGFIVYIMKDEIRATQYFAFENELIADISKIKSGGVSEAYLRAIEDTSLYTITHQHMENLYEQLPVWQKFGRLVWEESFASVLRGVHGFQLLTAKERYLDLLKRSDLVNRVPLKDLSLFLGITPSSLSRIRKEIAREK